MAFLATLAIMLIPWRPPREAGGELGPGGLLAVTLPQAQGVWLPCLFPRVTAGCPRRSRDPAVGDGRPLPSPFPCKLSEDCPDINTRRPPPVFPRFGSVRHWRGKEQG